MLMIVYLIAVMILTPILYDLFNRRVTDTNNRVAVLVRGFPSYLINLIICGVEAVVALVMPGGWGFDFFNLLIVTALIYLGNQFVFNAAVKLYSRARNAVESRP
jgi:hypothetical protein